MTDVQTVAALQWEDLEYTYPPLTPHMPSTPVLRNICLTLHRGERGLLLGPTGAGKTTLLLTSVGIIPQRTGGRFRGRVLVAGQDTRHTPVAQMATRVGFLFQDPEAQLFHVRVDDEVAFALENLGLPEEEITRRVRWALEAVGLWHLRHHPPAQLSGGEKQRLALAAVLAMQPAILVLDEPTANLDPVGREDLLHVLQALAAEGRTLFLATQETDWGIHLADTMHILVEGQLIASGPISTIRMDALPSPDVQALLPQTVQITHALRGHGFSVPLCLDIDQTVKALVPLLARASPPARSLSPLTEVQPSPPLPMDLSPTPSKPPSIVLRDVHYTYPSGVRALRGVTLHVEPGEFVALVGPNGAGKSTLARLCNGLLKPTQGVVQVGGQDTHILSPAQLARRIGYVFQHPDHQIFAATVWEELAFGPRNLGVSDEEVTRRVEELLRRFHLEAYRDVPPAVLGFGLRRKVALASVLAMQPAVLILDEPTGGLDATAGRDVMHYVAAYHRAGHTIILITHDMRLVAEWAPRTVVLQEGRILYDGPTRTLFQRPDLLHLARLTPPPVTQLAQKLEPWGFPPDVLTVSEFVAAFLNHAGPPPPSTDLSSGNGEPDPER